MGHDPHIWGLKEGAEKDCSSLEEFIQDELFSKHMGLANIEVMQAHRTKINQRLRALALRSQGLFTSTYLDIPIKDEF